MKCYNCGCENDDARSFCRECGVTLRQNDEEKFKKNVEILNDEFKVNKKRQPYPSPSVDSIQAKILYKKDQYSGQLRLAKTKCATIVVFTAFFLFSFAILVWSGNVIIAFFAALAFGLMFALPVAVIGFVLGLVIDKITH